MSNIKIILSIKGLNVIFYVRLHPQNNFSHNLLTTTLIPFAGKIVTPKLNRKYKVNEEDKIFTWFGVITSKREIKFINKIQEYTMQILLTFIYLKPNALFAYLPSLFLTFSFSL